MFLKHLLDCPEAAAALAKHRSGKVITSTEGGEGSRLCSALWQDREGIHIPATQQASLPDSWLTNCTPSKTGVHNPWKCWIIQMVDRNLGVIGALHLFALISEGAKWFYFLWKGGGRLNQFRNLCYSSLGAKRLEAQRDEIHHLPRVCLQKEWTKYRNICPQQTAQKNRLIQVLYTFPSMRQ